MSGISCWTHFWSRFWTMAAQTDPDSGRPVSTTILGEWVGRTVGPFHRSGAFLNGRGRGRNPTRPIFSLAASSRRPRFQHKLVALFGRFYPTFLVSLLLHYERDTGNVQSNVL